MEREVIATYQRYPALSEYMDYLQDIYKFRTADVANKFLLDVTKLWNFHKVEKGGATK